MRALEQRSHRSRRSSRVGELRRLSLPTQDPSVVLWRERLTCSCIPPPPKQGAPARTPPLGLLLPPVALLLPKAAAPFPMSSSALQPRARPPVSPSSDCNIWNCFNIHITKGGRGGRSQLRRVWRVPCFVCRSGCPQEERALRR